VNADEFAAVAQSLMDASLVSGAVVGVLAFVAGWLTRLGTALMEAQGERLADRVDDRLVEQMARMRIERAERGGDTQR
jgi:hypothetical protein